MSTVELLARLIDKSLLVGEQGSRGMRYRLLETMRAYAHDQLVQSGEAEAIGSRYVAHFLRLAEQAEAQLIGKEHVVWLDLLATESWERGPPACMSGRCTPATLNPGLLPVASPPLIPNSA